VLQQGKRIFEIRDSYSCQVNGIYLDRVSCLFVDVLPTSVVISWFSQQFCAALNFVPQHAPPAFRPRHWCISVRRNCVLCSVAGNFEIEPARRNPSIKDGPVCFLVMTVGRCEGKPRRRSTPKSGAKFQFKRATILSMVRATTRTCVPHIWRADRTRAAIPRACLIYLFKRDAHYW